MIEDQPNDEKVTGYLEIVRERTDAIKSLTEELFRYSVITSASEELCPVNLSLNRELEIALAGA
ncbi:MAG: hypothetical protein SOW34_18480 [Oliverpabstia sp.]|nr:hypothetical protein [Oliverpabstia sp.]